MKVPKKIKVLECIRQGNIGGGESHLLSLVENMDRSRFDPIVLSFTDGPMIGRMQELKVRTKVIPTLRPFDLSTWRSVKRFLKAEKFDLVHAHGTRANSNVLWSARSLGIPVIYTVHGWSFHQDQGRVTKWMRILGERYLVSRSQLNISVSASNQQTGRQYIPSFRSIVINNGIDQKKFNPERQFKDIRKQLGIDPDRILVVFIARFTTQKQPLALIRAFASAREKIKGMHLLMVGDGDEKEDAVRLVEEKRLTKAVTLLPFRADVPDILAAADIFVLPSLWEGLPIGLLEAMAMGRAVIASGVDGTREILNHGQNGWLVDTQDLDDGLTRSLLELGNDATLRSKLGAGARKTVCLQFNASEMTRHIESVYSNLLKQMSN